MEQLDLTGMAPRSPQKRRLFFCIHPEPAAETRIERLIPRLQAAHGLRGKPISRDRLHATVEFLGERKVLPPKVIERARLAAATVSRPAFDIRFDRVTSFLGRPGNHPLVLLATEGAGQVVALHAALDSALRKLGMPTVSQPPLAHITLMYDACRIAEQPIEPIAWRVREFSLVESHVGLGRHVRHGTWRLHD